MQELTEQYEQNKKDLYEQLDQKDQSLSEVYQQLNDAQKELQNQQDAVVQAENAIREYRAKMRNTELEIIQYKERYEQNEEETMQIKADMQSIIGYKNELELLIDEQTANIAVCSKKILTLEETLRHKEQEQDKNDGLIRRMTESNNETKKKLLQAEVKIRQLTQATIKDLKLKLKERQNEVEVLKEMVKSSTNSLKAKDLDNQRLSKRIQRLEKLVEINRNFEAPASRLKGYGDMQNQDEGFGDTDNSGGQGFNFNEQVNQELI